MSGNAIKVAVLLSVACTVLSGQAGAHAHLQGAVPMPNGVVNGSPKQIRLQFSERIEPKFSAVSLADSAGHKLAIGRPQSEPNNARVLMVRVNSTLGGGVYVVGWRAVSTDTHKTSGTYKFTVKAR